jgi:hypothetical protein
MLFSIGVKVQFKFTGETGTVTALLGDGMLQVRLDSDFSMEIPAFEEDLCAPGGATSVSGHSKGKGNPFAPGNNPAPPARRVLSASYVILKPQGVQLAFEPMPGRDGTVIKYKAWLINDTQHEFILEFDLTTTQRDIGVLDEKLPAMTAIEVGDLLSDDLNEHPEAWISLQRITTAGLDTPLKKLLKIKPKQFFQQFKTAPVIGVPAYHLQLINQLNNETTSEGMSLKDYTKQVLGQRRPRRQSNSVPFRANDVEAYATFSPEIDLHAEVLLPGHRGIDKSEILRLQMQHFQRFLDRAILLGVPSVFIIHGVGEGKLSEAVATALRANPHVLKFKNEFHHKYGYGATEVILQ